MGTPCVKIFIVAFTILFLACNRDYVNFTVRPDYLATFRCSSNQLSDKNIARSEQFGLFSSSLWEDYFTNLHTEIEHFGVFPRYIHWYIQMDDKYPEDIIHYNNAMGIKTIINQDLRSIRFSAKQNSAILAEIIDGKWDRHFRSFARHARRAKDTLYYRFGYEMNGDWFPWCEQPDRFVEAWRHVWNIFYYERAYNVRWVFSPSVIWDNSPFLHQIHPYYPGDPYVDIVALDGYNFGDDHSRYHKWQSFEEVFGESLAMIHEYNKPIWIAEIGCATDSRRKEWLEEFFTFMDQSCCINVFLWFNDHKQGEPDFRIQSDTASLAVFRDWVSNNSEFSKGLM